MNLETLITNKVQDNQVKKQSGILCDNAKKTTMNNEKSLV